ncbi:MAG: hypothetical protein NT090_05390 [Acidobacteria bacterium]|nr:hypothetical protein [Acidobacteriota bacterium]
MEVAKVQLARAVWLFDTQELTPRGNALYPTLFDTFIRRYKFPTFPKPEEIHSGGSLYFKQGKFVWEASSVDIDCDLHNDGLVASCRHSTEVADAFLQDFVVWLGEQLGVAYPPTLSRKRIYRSELIVNMAIDLNSTAEKLRQFSRLLSAMSKQEAQTTGITFGSDRASLTFAIERRVNVPFEENRYFSGAALQTSHHIEALVAFEQLLARSD